MSFRLAATLMFAVVIAIAAMWFLQAPPKEEPRDSNATISTSGDQDVGNTATVDSFVTFELMTDASGVDFVHNSGTSTEKPFPAVNGSGVAAFDFDRDGWCDLQFANGTQFPIDPKRTGSHDHCYRNLGDWKFQDVSKKCGLDHAGYSAGLTTGDFDNDGFPDLYVNCVGENQLFRNMGDGTFENVTAEAGVGDSRWGTSAAFFDANEDGLLDIYACNYAAWSYETNAWCGNRERGIRIYCNPSTVAPIADAFYLSNGDGTFREALEEAGLGVRAGRGQGVVAADINGDQHADLYLGNDQNPNGLFLGDGTGHFRDATETSGAGYDWQGRSQAGMGVACGDINGDGQFELFVTNFEQDHNSLYSNYGGGMFEDSSDGLGVAAPGRPWIGWGTAFADFDGNGWPDLVVTNGHVDSNLHELGQDSPYEHPPLMLRNDGGRFSVATGGCGAYFQSAHPGRGLVLADLDNDGDPDVVITHMDSAPALLRNDFQSNNGARPITLRLSGRTRNRDAIGVTVTQVRSGLELNQQITGGGSYLSSSELSVFVSETPQTTVKVRWPSGTESVVDIDGHSVLTVVEPLAE